MSAGAAAGTAEPQSRVTLKTWTAISLWSYDVDLAENCAICLNALVERCIDCTVDLSSPEECVQVWGVCSYVPLAARCIFFAGPSPWFCHKMTRVFLCVCAVQTTSTTNTAFKSTCAQNRRARPGAPCVSKATSAGCCSLQLGGVSRGVSVSCRVVRVCRSSGVEHAKAWALAHGRVYKVGAVEPLGGQRSFARQTNESQRQRVQRIFIAHSKNMVQKRCNLQLRPCPGTGPHGGGWSYAARGAVRYGGDHGLPPQPCKRHHGR
jgi:hypothetical protein